MCLHFGTRRLRVPIPGRRRSVARTPGFAHARVPLGPTRAGLDSRCGREKAGRCVVEDHWYRRMFASSPVAQALSDAEGLFVDVNAAYCELVGLTSSELIGRSATVHTHPDDLPLHGSVEDLMAAGTAAEESVKVEVRFVRPNDEIRWVLLTLVPFTGPSDAEWTLAAALDITERKEIEDGILRASRTDQLTGALNRRGWSDYAVSVVDGDSVDTVVAVLDLDHFKQFNDHFGHAAGDALLRDFASTARSCIGVDGLLARWGGEEFVITLRNCDRRGALRSLEALAAATTPSGVTFSAGYTLQRPNEGLRNTLDRADALMFQAKRAGRNRMITDAPH
ncbi:MULTISPECIES: GGDEF domain-containing protein [unclassified Rhodococcus (in: high G+C Gram-positive bacteria)]|uniref:GGDEF domain-containing protein n=1 Tax=unclassified Rhodococcus (in: high G+C Gram-positive bacteria) TaxID=192944 RepID=UPI00211AC8B5|nr:MULTISPECIES: sensor domain-containing diguanylate cyclase [unclassified Rhodococcus (in: high G+C Gram-positive bacteria)]